MIKLLSIDDSKAVHAFLTGLFENTDSTLHHAFDGSEGVALLADGKLPALDAILLDWEMPILTGIETLKKIREMGLKTPIIMLTSKNDPKEIMEALSLGANEYVMKPFTREILFEKLESILGRKLG